MSLNLKYGVVPILQSLPKMVETIQRLSAYGVSFKGHNMYKRVYAHGGHAKFLKAMRLSNLNNEKAMIRRWFFDLSILHELLLHPLCGSLLTSTVQLLKSSLDLS